MNTLNILFIIYDLERGGPEMRLLNFAKYFPKNLKMHICVTSENLALLNDFNNYKIPIHVVPIKKAYLEFQKTRKIYKYVMANDIQIINVFDIKGLIICALIKIFRGKCIKIVYNNVNSLENLSLRCRVALRMLLKLADASISNSVFSKNQFKKLIPGIKTKVIYNGVDNELFKQDAKIRNMMRAKLKINSNNIIIGIVANFREQKNHTFLLNAFGQVSGSYENLKLLCVGGGRYLETIKKMAQDQGISEKVIFVGYSKDVVGYLNIIDILVLTSLFEGLPNVILEAMCMNIPVITSSVGGCPEIIENMQNGILFSPNNYGEFISALEKLINDQSLCAILTNNAKKTIEEKFPLDLMVKKYAIFFENVSEK